MSKYNGMLPTLSMAAVYMPATGSYYGFYETTLFGGVAYPFSGTGNTMAREKGLLAGLLAAWKSENASHRIALVAIFVGGIGMRVPFLFHGLGGSVGGLRLLRCVGLLHRPHQHILFRIHRSLASHIRPPERHQGAAEEVHLKLAVACAVTAVEPNLRKPLEYYFLKYGVPMDYLFSLEMPQTGKREAKRAFLIADPKDGFPLQRTLDATDIEKGIITKDPVASFPNSGAVYIMKDVTLRKPF